MPETDVQVKTEKLFTQAEVNTIVQERLKKERERNTSYEDFKIQFENLKREMSTLKQEYAQKNAELLKEKIESGVISEMHKQNIISPNELYKLFVANAFLNEEGNLCVKNEHGDEVTFKEHLSAWADANGWAIRDRQNAGSGCRNIPPSFREPTDEFKKAFSLD